MKIYPDVIPCGVGWLVQAAGANSPGSRNTFPVKLPLKNMSITYYEKAFIAPTKNMSLTYNDEKLFSLAPTQFNVNHRSSRYFG
jgi:hypothetical protein